MMSLLFILFLVSMSLTLAGKKTPSFIVYGLAMVLSIFWLLHHASSTLNIQL
jgi:hypothetical protein